VALVESGIDLRSSARAKNTDLQAEAAGRGTKLRGVAVPSDGKRIRTGL
jgi:hypothetical protein